MSNPEPAKPNSRWHNSTAVRSTPRYDADQRKSLEKYHEGRDWFRGAKVRRK